MYLDDERYSKHNVRILIVGTPTDIRDYFAAQENGQTIVNRVQEVPEVSVLHDSQTAILARRGLIEMLKYSVEETFKAADGAVSEFGAKTLFANISWFTANVPQYIHELCLELSLEAESQGGKITSDLFYGALLCWFRGSLISEHSRLEQNVNSVETKHGRRNQVIYALSNSCLNEFNYQDIEADVRKLFPESTSSRTLNVSGVLSELSSGRFPLIRKVPKGTRYRFIDPRIKIVARWMLSKVNEESEVLTIKRFDDSMKLF